MSMRTKRTSWLVLGAVTLAYACGDNTTPIPDDDGGVAGSKAGGSSAGANSVGGASNGGKGMGGSNAGNGGAPGTGGAMAGGGSGGDGPVPVYEQDDPNLMPTDASFQRVRIPVSVHNAMQIDVDKDENVYIMERDGALHIWKPNGEVVDAGMLDT